MNWRRQIETSSRNFDQIMRFNGRTVALSILASAYSYMAKVPRENAYYTLFDHLETKNPNFAAPLDEAKALLRQ